MAKLLIVLLFLSGYSELLLAKSSCRYPAQTRIHADEEQASSVLTSMLEENLNKIEERIMQKSENCQKIFRNPEEDCGEEAKKRSTKEVERIQKLIQKERALREKKISETQIDRTTIPGNSFSTPFFLINDLEKKIEVFQGLSTSNKEEEIQKIKKEIKRLEALDKKFDRKQATINKKIDQAYSKKAKKLFDEKKQAENLWGKCKNSIPKGLVTGGLLDYGKKVHGEWGYQCSLNDFELKRPKVNCSNKSGVCDIEVDIDKIDLNVKTGFLSDDQATQVNASGNVKSSEPRKIKFQVKPDRNGNISVVEKSFKIEDSRKNDINNFQLRTKGIDKGLQRVVKETMKEGYFNQALSNIINSQLVPNVLAPTFEKIINENLQSQLRSGLNWEIPDLQSRLDAKIMQEDYKKTKNRIFNLRRQKEQSFSSGSKSLSMEDKIRSQMGGTQSVSSSSYKSSKEELIDSRFLGFAKNASNETALNNVKSLIVDLQAYEGELKGSEKSRWKTRELKRVKESIGQLEKARVFIEKRQEKWKESARAIDLEFKGLMHANGKFSISYGACHKNKKEVYPSGGSLEDLPRSCLKEYDLAAQVNIDDLNNLSNSLYESGYFDLCMQWKKNGECDANLTPEQAPFLEINNGELYAVGSDVGLNKNGFFGCLTNINVNQSFKLKINSTGAIDGSGHFSTNDVETKVEAYKDSIKKSKVSKKGSCMDNAGKMIGALATLPVGLLTKAAVKVGHGSVLASYKDQIAAEANGILDHKRVRVKEIRPGKDGKTLNLYFDYKRRGEEYNPNLELRDDLTLEEKRACIHIREKESPEKRRGRPQRQQQVQ